MTIPVEMTAKYTPVGFAIEMEGRVRDLTHPTDRCPPVPWAWSSARWCSWLRADADWWTPSLRCRRTPWPWWCSRAPRTTSSRTCPRPPPSASPRRWSRARRCSCCSSTLRCFRPPPCRLFSAVVAPAPRSAFPLFRTAQPIGPRVFSTRERTRRREERTRSRDRPLNRRDVRSCRAPVELHDQQRKRAPASVTSHSLSAAARRDQEGCLRGPGGGKGLFRIDSSKDSPREISIIDVSRWYTCVAPSAQGRGRGGNACLAARRDDAAANQPFAFRSNWKRAASWLAYRIFFPGYNCMLKNQNSTLPEVILALL